MLWLSMLSLGSARSDWLRLCLIGMRRLGPSHLGVLLLGLGVGLTGCQPAASTAKSDAQAQLPAELSWPEQIARVRQGQSEEIRLEQIPVPPNDLSQLAELKGLKTLILDAGLVDDAHVSSLAGLSGLEHLRLRSSPLSDQGLVELASYRLDRLMILNIPQAQPTARGLAALAALPRIRQLRIAGRQIDDAAIASLLQWPALTSLHLISPNISEAALKTIAAMPELSSFYIDDCPLSDEAWEQLFRQRPQLHVHIDQAHHDRDPQPGH